MAEVPGREDAPPRLQGRSSGCLLDLCSHPGTRAPRGAVSWGLARRLCYQWRSQVCWGAVGGQGRAPGLDWEGAEGAGRSQMLSPGEPGGGRGPRAMGGSGRPRGPDPPYGRLGHRGPGQGLEEERVGESRKLLPGPGGAGGLCGCCRPMQSWSAETAEPPGLPLPRVEKPRARRAAGQGGVIL